MKGEREVDREKESERERETERERGGGGDMWDEEWKLKKTTWIAPSQLTELIFRCKFSARSAQT